MIRGVFAFAWTDGRRLIVARDPFGVRLLFYKKGQFASEVKALTGKVDIFPHGHFMTVIWMILFVITRSIGL